MCVAELFVPCVQQCAADHSLDEPLHQSIDAFSIKFSRRVDDEGPDLDRFVTYANDEPALSLFICPSAFIDRRWAAGAVFMEPAAFPCCPSLN